MDYKIIKAKNQIKILLSILLLVLAGIITASCATEVPAVAHKGTPLIAAMSPEKPIIIRIALAYISKQGLDDKFDLESAEIVKRTYEAYYVEVKQYPAPGKKQKTSVVKVYTEDGYPEWERW